MKILLCGGGTGGHVYPAIAIAEELQVQQPDADFAFVGQEDSFESRAAAARSWRFIAMSAAGLKGKGLVRQLRNFVTVMHALWQASVIVRRERPDCVVGTGGYVSGPLLLVAAMLGVPTLVHEQNSVPGITNRLLSRVVRRVCVTYASSARYFPERKVVVTGLPLRHAVRSLCETAVAQSEHRPTLLVMGGSQGARQINRVVSELFMSWSQSALPVRVIHLAGQQGNVEELQACYAASQTEAQVQGFSDDMASVYAQATLAVCRAGASSVAELAMTGVPAIFVPFPFATDDHQTTNARELVEQGAAVMIAESEFTESRLREELLHILGSNAQRASMAQAMRAWAKPDAALAIVRECFTVMGAKLGVAHV